MRPAPATPAAKSQLSRAPKPGAHPLAPPRARFISSTHSISPPLTPHSAPAPRGNARARTQNSIFRADFGPKWPKCTLITRAKSRVSPWAKPGPDGGRAPSGPRRSQLHAADGDFDHGMPLGPVLTSTRHVSERLRTKGGRSKMVEKNDFPARRHFNPRVRCVKVSRKTPENGPKTWSETPCS